MEKKDKITKFDADNRVLQSIRTNQTMDANSVNAKKTNEEREKKEIIYQVSFHGEVCVERTFG